MGRLKESSDMEAALERAREATSSTHKDDALSVSAALALAQGALENVTVRLVGEVSEVSNKRGYKAVYFSVKDEKSVLPCQMWVSRYQAAGVELAVGQLVELTGRFTLWAAKGRMNFEVRRIELAGEGKLRMQVANLARMLEAEGLMSPARKRPVPAYPATIGVVTSPRGKAVHDVLRTLRRRFPVARVVLAGVTVEGANAVEDILEGMRCMVRAHVEVMLLVRGGGTYEELMPFNDERIARAITKCPMPVVTGIGHEPDNSIADMVADVRTSTPTHAAEAVTPARESLETLFAARARSLGASIGRTLDHAEAELRRCATRPLFCDSDLLFSSESLALDAAAERLFKAIPANLERDKAQVARQAELLARALPASLAREHARIERQRVRLAACGASLTASFEQQAALAAARLNDLSPLATLGRGYAIARTGAGEVVRSVDAVAAGSDMNVTVADGVLECRVESTKRVEVEVVDWKDER